MNELTGLTEGEAAELAYGLLWHMRLIDRHTFDCRLASDARVAIGNAIGHDRKRAGVKRAQDFIAAHPMPSATVR